MASSDIIISQKYFDFGNLNYNFNSQSQSIPFEIKNVSENVPYKINLTIIDYSIYDFPVKLECESWTDDKDQVLVNDSVVIVQPGGKIAAKVYLRVNNESISINNPRTSFFKAANRCHINYFLVDQPDSDLSAKVEFQYSAMLCTSIMFLDKKEIDFQECSLNDITIQEIMIWNRSEAELSFQILEDTLQSQNVSIVFYEAEKDEPVGKNVISIPSFAPKMIQVHVSGKVRETVVYFLVLIINNCVYLGPWKLRIALSSSESEY
jgi:hypothetical protein